MCFSVGTYTTLCRPDSEKTCFFCCPPLRPHGYDPLRKCSALEPVFRRNREEFLKKNRILSTLTPRPINGWDCWGLGYLDEDEKGVGCFLHPTRNNGTDYRYLVGYEGKCAREICLEAKTFETLGERTKEFFLKPTTGMDSFEYSSRERNPIFRILLWGKTVCEKIAETEGFQAMQPDEFNVRYETFFGTLSYKTDGYLVEKIVEKEELFHSPEPDFLDCYKKWKDDVLQKYRGGDPPSQVIASVNPSYRPVHLFEVPLSFSRFLKFSLNLWNAPEAQVIALKKDIDYEIECFTLQRK